MSARSTEDARPKQNEATDARTDALCILTLIMYVELADAQMLRPGEDRCPPDICHPMVHLAHSNSNTTHQAGVNNVRRVPGK